MKNWTVDNLYPTVVVSFLTYHYFVIFGTKQLEIFWEIFLISNVVLYFCEEPLVPVLKLFWFHT